jgi:hypothetical protein
MDSDYIVRCVLEMKVRRCMRLAWHNTCLVAVLCDTYFGLRGLKGHPSLHRCQQVRPNARHPPSPTKSSQAIRSSATIAICAASG